MITVSARSVTAIKAMRLRKVDAIQLGPDGADGNRRFYLIDDDGRMVNGKTVGALQAIIADADRDRLTLTFPAGDAVEGTVAYGGTVETTFFSRARTATLIEGPWSEAISKFVGNSLRLVEADGDGAAVDRGRGGGVSLISSASLERLAAEAEASDLDPRRFRMLIEVDGLGPHEEDAWIGQRAQIGDAVVEFGGHVGRCLITSRDPDTGTIDLPTLDVLRSYRGDAITTEPLPFGVYGHVVSPGAVRLGDKVSLA
jgi:uncharacterized protein YcbX